MPSNNLLFTNEYSSTYGLVDLISTASAREEVLTTAFKEFMVTGEWCCGATYEQRGDILLIEANRGPLMAINRGQITCSPERVGRLMPLIEKLAQREGLHLELVEDLDIVVGGWDEITEPYK